MIRPDIIRRYLQYISNTPKAGQLLQPVGFFDFELLELPIAQWLD
jgi:hypothetical protein